MDWYENSSGSMIDKKRLVLVDDKFCPTRERVREYDSYPFLSCASFSLEVGRQGTTHNLGLRLSRVNVCKVDGKAYDFVRDYSEKYGLEHLFDGIVPIARILFSDESFGGSVKRSDSHLGDVYAQRSEVDNAFRSTLMAVSGLEGAIADLSGLYPQTQTSKQIQIDVTIEGFWDYFLRFDNNILNHSTFVDEVSLIVPKHYSTKGDVPSVCFDETPQDVVNLF